MNSKRGANIMGAQPKEMPRKADQPQHYYHADAYVLKADLQQPVTSEIQPQGLVELPEDGAYQYQEVGPFKLKGVLSYSSGYTQVAGHPSSKGKGFTTLSTSVIENLNVLDVVTADRVVGQISTEHPQGKEQVPSVTFLGTRFVNLRIGGHKVEINQDIHVLGAKPKKDASYFEDSGALARMTRQFEHIRKMKNLPEWAEEEFVRDKSATKNENKAQLSLVNSVNGAPGANFGHVIDVPHFGKIYLAELAIERQPEPRNSDYKDQYTFKLRMIRLDMGCIATGNTTVVALDANGKGKGGGG
jgi:hypothetical protein